MWDSNIYYQAQMEHYEALRREVEAYRLAQKLAAANSGARFAIAARFRSWLSMFGHKLQVRFAEKGDNYGRFRRKKSSA